MQPNPIPGTVVLKCRTCSTELDSILSDDELVSRRLEDGVTCPICGQVKLRESIFIIRSPEKSPR
jgi:DNA-directed RNA polymerase subunit RPC12/RpoP